MRFFGRAPRMFSLIGRARKIAVEFWCMHVDNLDANTVQCLVPIRTIDIARVLGRVQVQLARDGGACSASGGFARLAS